MESFDELRRRVQELTLLTENLAIQKEKLNLLAQKWLVMKQENREKWQTIHALKNQISKMNNQQ